MAGILLSTTMINTVLRKNRGIHKWILITQRKRLLPTVQIY